MPKDVNPLQTLKHYYQSMKFVFDEETAKKVVELRSVQRKNTKVICEMLNLSKYAVEKYYDMYHIRGYYDYSKKFDEQITELWNKGFSVKEICKKTGLTYDQVKGRKEHLNLYGRGCHYESGEYLPKAIEELKSYGLIYLSGYKDMESQVTLKCAKCGNVFTIKFHNLVSKMRGYNNNLHSKYIPCSKCREKNVNKFECVCKYCGIKFFSSNYRSQCERCKKIKVKQYRKGKEVRLKGKIVDKDITIESVAKKYNDICYLCGKKVDWQDFYYDENGYFIAGHKYPSIEHLKPLSKGGLHSWENVNLAHRDCNWLKKTELAYKPIPLDIFVK